MHDVFEGGYIHPEFLAACVRKVRDTKTYDPKVLVLSHDGFRRLNNAIWFHGQSHPIRSGYKAAGIERVVWAEDVPDGEFLLSSGKDLPEGIETLFLL